MTLKQIATNDIDDIRKCKHFFLSFNINFIDKSNFHFV